MAPGSIGRILVDMRLRLRRAPVRKGTPGFSVDTSPHADRLRLAGSFSTDDETARTGEERHTYDPTCAVDLRHLAVRR